MPDVSHPLQADSFDKNLRLVTTRSCVGPGASRYYDATLAADDKPAATRAQFDTLGSRIGRKILAILLRSVAQEQVFPLDIVWCIWVSSDP